MTTRAVKEKRRRWYLMAKVRLLGRALDDPMWWNAYREEVRNGAHRIGTHGSVKRP